MYKISKTDVNIEDINSTASDEDDDQNEIFQSDKYWEICEQNF